MPLSNATARDRVRFVAVARRASVAGRSTTTVTAPAPGGGSSGGGGTAPVALPTTGQLWPR